LETRHKIVSEPSQVRLTPHPPPHFLLKPQVEHKVQIHVGQDWAEHPSYAKGNFQFERVIVGWRAQRVLDLRRKT
jgi:hypothetical protein